jgi:hypothetical protein
MSSGYLALSFQLCPEEGSELAAWRPDVVKSLLDILRDVTHDPEQGAAFHADPSHFLAEQGYHDVADEDLREAFSLVADTLPAAKAHEVYTAHVVSHDVGDTLHEIPHQEDPGAGYGDTDPFDLDVHDAVNKVIEPHDVDDHGFGFGHGADHDDVGDHGHDLAAMHHTDDGDEYVVHSDPAFDHHQDHDVDQVDDHHGLGLDVDVNPFDEHGHGDDHGLHDAAGTHGMHDAGAEHDHGHHAVDHHDIDHHDLGLF